MKNIPNPVASQSAWTGSKVNFRNSSVSTGGHKQTILHFVDLTGTCVGTRLLDVLKCLIDLNNRYFVCNPKHAKLEEVD